MSLALYGHPFSSYTQKVLIALDENRTQFEFRILDETHPEHAEDWLKRWPMALSPLLVDGDRQFMEASIVIEHLHLAHRGPAPLLPDDPHAALDVRFMDRFFDLYVMDAMQVAVAAKLGRAGMPPETGLDLATQRLTKAYGWLETYLAGREWAVGESFSLADCAAAPSLFYADWVFQIPDDYPNVRAYRQRLLARPSVARAVDGGRPYRHLFPLGAPDRD